METVPRVIKTIAYFDLFDRPLTSGEVWRWLWADGNSAGVSLREIILALETLKEKQILREENGVFYLFDRKREIIFTRESRYRSSVRKWRRARRWANFFSGLPGVKMVSVGNTLSYNNAKDSSDIDFFIITAPGAIWRTRFFCAAAAALFNLRPKNGNNRDKLCLSFFATTLALNFSQLGGDEKLGDVYMRYWIRLMRPLAGYKNAIESFFKENCINAEGPAITPSKFWQIALAPLALLPKNFLKQWQKNHFPPAIKMAEEKNNGSVIISDNILKFHINDRRAQIFKEWTERVSVLIAKIHNSGSL
jgi:hypothetical protein